MPGIFPQASDQIINNVKISRRLPGYGKSPVFDFAAGEFKKVDGKVYIGEGVEILKNWIEKTLKTERYRFAIYGPDYGVTLEELVARNLPFSELMNELREQISDALVQDIRISRVDNFKFAKDRDRLEIQFEIETFENETVAMEVKI